MNARWSYTIGIIAILALVVFAISIPMTATAQQIVTATPNQAQLVVTATPQFIVVPYGSTPMPDLGIIPTLTPTPAPTNSVNEVARSKDSLAYPALVIPDPSREKVFPNVKKGNRAPLAAYETPFESGDFCDNSTPCSVDVPQYYYRLMTAGQISMPDLGINCIAGKTQGCLVLIINHFGPTSMFRNNTVDSGFTVAGRVFDMGTPDKVTTAGQALLDHFVGRMTGSQDGANCGTIDACGSVEWHVVVIGNSVVQIHWSGIYTR